MATSWSCGMRTRVPGCVIFEWIFRNVCFAWNATFIIPTSVSLSSRSPILRLPSYYSSVRPAGDHALRYRVFDDSIESRRIVLSRLKSTIDLSTWVSRNH